VLMLCLSMYDIKLLCSDFIDAEVLLVSPETIAFDNTITSGLVLQSEAASQSSICSCKSCHFTIPSRRAAYLAQ
jgi:hypothetical protein